MYFSVNNLLCVHFIWMEYSGWKTWTMLHAAPLLNGVKTDLLVSAKPTGPINEGGSRGIEKGPTL
ncbi:hypothetical protein BHM03_00005160 [Ensete ventricosum]|nr:hypothetical protein BHM03_00005160 [Ensete ventricosum]